MSEHKSEYRYESASCEDDDLYDLNLKSGSGVSDSRSTMFEENGRQKTGTMFEEDGDAGSPSVFQSARPVASGVRVNTEPKVVASVNPIGRTPVVPDQSHAIDPSRSTARKLPATSTMAPTYPNASLSPSVLTSFKKWSLNTLKYTKQYVSERLGQTPRTVDPETEARVEALRETQRQYLHILRLARTLHLHFQRLVQTQRVLGDAFGQLAAKNAELTEQFAYNAETQKLLARNGEVLLAALNVFMTSMSTLCNTTIEDTLMTVKNHEAARIKYDADRLYLDGLRLQMQTRDASAISKAQDAERIFQLSKQRFDRLYNDLAIKLRFLDENKVTVCQKHLYLLHKGFVSYVAGNRDGVEEVLRHVHETALRSDTTPSSDASPSTTVMPSDTCHAAVTDVCHASSTEAFQPSSD